MSTTRRFLKKIALLLGAMLLLLMLFASLTNSAVHAYPTFWVLSVTGYPQPPGLGWCWAATDKSIMAYHGTNPAQCEIVNVGLGRDYCCNNPSACNQGLSTCDNDVVFQHWGFQYTCVHYPLSFDSIRSEIYYGNRPFYASVYSHAHTVAGYDYGPPEAIYHYDPAQGQWYVWTYDNFVAGWAATIYRVRE